MIPQPPFAGDLDLEQELEAFRALKPRLIEVWDALTAADDSHCTSVVVPSLTLNQGELSKLAGVAYYEERLLFLLIRLRNPRAHMVYVTSQPVHPMILDYYLNLLAGVPAAHARARLTMLCCHDASPRPLTQKIMERPRLVQRIREAIPDPKRTYLTVFNSTPLERKLAVLLGIPLNGLDPDLQYYGTKSGSRHVLRQAGVPMAEGYEDLHDESDIVKALCELQRKRPGLRRAIVKLNESFSGEGNAVVTYPEAPSGDVAAALSNLSLPTERDTRATFFGELRRMGGVVEEYVEAPDKRSPSVQLRTSPRGEVMPISTHDQILGGPLGQTYLGCRFPAHDDYRQAIAGMAERVGGVLADKGVVSRFGVDFLACRQSPGDPWSLTALEINLRLLGTTHPFLALSFLTGGHLDTATGQFISLGGRPKFYRATDNLRSDRYRSLVPEDLLDIVTDNRLHYSHRTESGVLFHLIGAVSEFGKLGVTSIANTAEEADALYEHTLQVLDTETAYGR
ncbi:MAG TPA: peptide ligase PGM1-related protein [Vicinamibacterales bacterium]|nr:peptide ligase PGM1-related protein [Vicinamibacterales bacterium]